MSTAPSIEHRKPWEEHSVVVALVLAVLIPGLGHLFQGRTLKGCIYLFGILGLFLWGVKLGEGVVVYNMPERGITRRVTLHYAAQFGAGLVSYPALLQPRRVSANGNHLIQLEAPLTSSFSGILSSGGNETTGEKLEGTVSFRPEPGEYGTNTVGTFKGTVDGQPVEWNLSGQFEIDPEVGASTRRGLKCAVVSEKDPITGANKLIVGSIPRPVYNWYGVPPDTETLQRLTGRLGKLHELALVFTWIAGLLNILAIWDCVQGPAYGFGDESWAAAPGNDKAEPAKPVGHTPAAPSATPV